MNLSVQKISLTMHSEKLKAEKPHWQTPAKRLIPREKRAFRS